MFIGSKPDDISFFFVPRYEKVRKVLPSVQIPNLDRKQK